MNTVRITYYGMDGEGRNVTEAKRDAGAKIENALTGNYTPQLIRGSTSEAVLIFREPSGWYYSPIHADSTGRVCTIGSYDTQKEAERKARQHLAQNIFTLDGLDGSEVILDKADKREHATWIEYQRLYKAWRDTGLADQQAHEKACRRLAPAA